MAIPQTINYVNGFRHAQLPVPIYLMGMHGRGDAIHQRAALRQLMKIHPEVWLESSWVSIYHDLIAQGLKVIWKETTLRTQRKNAAREKTTFFQKKALGPCKVIRVHTSPDLIWKHGSVLAAMCAAVGVDYATADFRMPINQEWMPKAQMWLDEWKPTKPLLFYRPPCVRPEWGGHAARNPDPRAYRELFDSIKDRFFTVGVADLTGENPRRDKDQREQEWHAAPLLDPKLDVRLYNGEIDSETMAALFSKAAFVFTTGGFAVILAQAVGTPVAALMGGYEDHKSYLGGARYSPYLGIDTINPCTCFKHTPCHPVRCNKRVDMPKAHVQLEDFLRRHVEIQAPHPVCEPARLSI